MSKAIGGTYVRTGKASLELAADDLFDRIINIKFIRKSGRIFTLRSDYEPVFHKNGTISFKACNQKPDIKISYKQVAESVAIEVDIEVTNLFIGDRDKENVDSMNTADGDPVQWCIIQMGYRQQFPDWTKIKETTDLARFWDLNNNNITSDAEVRRGSQIVVQILVEYTKTYPPDRVTYFKGVIGTLENGLRWYHDEDELVKGYGDKEFPEEFSWLEEILFQFVSRRFIRPSVVHTVVTNSDMPYLEMVQRMQERKYIHEIWIDYYDDYPDPGASAEARLAASAKMAAADSKTALAKKRRLTLLENGVMSVKDANKFGVICAVSRTLRSMAAPSLYGAGLNKEEAASLNPIPATAFNDMQDTLGGQLTSIRVQFPFLRWYELTDGNFFFYHVDDTDEDLWSDPYIKKAQKNNLQFLPAVYDITPSGTRTIRCPFISFISPMTTVVFQSRFTLGTLVSFYYPSKTNAYLVITASIEFATVQDNNLMELMCVDLPPHEIDVDETGYIHVKESDKIPEVTQMQQQRNKEWIEKSLTVVKHKTGATDTDSSWANIVANELKPTFRPENWPEGTEFSELLALNALKVWNPDYFDPDGKYMKRSNTKYGESIENAPSGIGGRTGIKVPWLKIGDKIVVRYPFQPEYPDDEKVTV
jgi:hypothetical protein